MTSLPEHQTRASSRLDRMLVVVVGVLLWVGRNVVPALATTGMTYTLGWLFIAHPTISYTPNSRTGSVEVTVSCDPLVAQHPGGYYGDLNAGATAVRADCAQQLAGRAAWVGGVAPLTLLCWVWTLRRRDPRTVHARILATRERLVGSVGPGGGQ